MIELVAHQGGWDEILLVAGPLAVFAAVLVLANKRAKAKLAERVAAQDEAEAQAGAAADGSHSTHIGDTDAGDIEDPGTVQDSR